MTEENVTVALATSSGTRKCNRCGLVIMNRTIMVTYELGTSLVFHPRCAGVLANDILRMIKGGVR